MYASSEPLRQAWRALMQTLPDHLLLAHDDAHPAVEVIFDDADRTFLSPHLLIGHTCGYPYLRRWRPTHELVAVPVWDLPGCDGIQYCSWFVCRRDDKRRSLEEFAQGTAALNHVDSNSGMNVLRFALKDLNKEGKFFRQVVKSGSHRESMRLIARGEVDMASIDAVSYHHILRDEPALAQAIRTFGRSEPTTGLPFIRPRNAKVRVDEISMALNRGLSCLCDDMREILGLTEFRYLEDSDYAPMHLMEKEAMRAGYPVLR